MTPEPIDIQLLEIAFRDHEDRNYLYVVDLVDQQAWMLWKAEQIAQIKADTEENN